MADGTFNAFLSQAGKKLNMKNPRAAYTRNGVEITADSLPALDDDEEVFVSEGGPFWKNGMWFISIFHIFCGLYWLLIFKEGKPGVYKIALLGVGGVGKSCITLKYIKGFFTEVYDPSIEVV